MNFRLRDKKHEIRFSRWRKWLTKNLFSYNTIMLPSTIPPQKKEEIWNMTTKKIVLELMCVSCLCVFEREEFHHQIHLDKSFTECKKMKNWIWLFIPTVETPLSSFLFYWNYQWMSHLPKCSKLILIYFLKKKKDSYLW